MWLIHLACSMMINRPTLAMTMTSRLQRTIVSRAQLRLHLMQKALILLMIVNFVACYGQRVVGPWHGTPLGEPLSAYTETSE